MLKADAKSLCLVLSFLFNNLVGAVPKLWNGKGAYPIHQSRKEIDAAIIDQFS